MVTARWQNFRILEPGFTVTRTPGTTPNSVEIPAYAPSEPKLSNGDLVIRDGRQSVTVKNLYLRSYTRATNQPHRFELVDSRHFWPQRPRLFGEYNKPNADGSANQEQSLVDLAKLALTNLRVARYDLRALLPLASLYPHVRWEWTAPADALQELCRFAGCLIHLQLDDTVAIVREGEGKLPRGKLRLAVKHEGVAEPLVPAKLTVRGGRIVKEETISSLVAVGLDTDGQILPLADLSYYPGGGFTDGAFQDLGLSDAELLAARDSIWKWYRLPDAHLYKLPILGERVTTATEDGVKKRRPPLVEVKQANSLDKADAPTRHWANDTSYVEFSSGYRLDSARGIVMFDHQTFKVTTSGSYVESAFVAADVRLTYAYESLDADGLVNADDFYTLEDGSGFDYELIEAPDLILYQIDGADQNRTVLDAYARGLVTQRRAAQVDAKSGDYRVIGIAPVRLDGLVRSVAYEVSPTEGVFTSIALSTEIAAPAAIPYREKLFIAETKAANRDAREQAARNRRAAPAGTGAAAAAPVVPATSTRHAGATGHRGFPVINLSGSAIPDHSLVELDGIDSTSQLLKVQAPSSDTAVNLAIVERGIANSAQGTAYETASHIVRVAAGVAKADRVGPQASSHVCQAANNGPLLVRDVRGSASGGQYACCFFTARATWLDAPYQAEIHTGTPSYTLACKAINDGGTVYDRRTFFKLPYPVYRDTIAWLSAMASTAADGHTAELGDDRTAASGDGNPGSARLFLTGVTETFTSPSWGAEPAQTDEALLLELSYSVGGGVPSGYAYYASAGGLGTGGGIGLLAIAGYNWSGEGLLYGFRLRWELYPNDPPEADAVLEAALYGTAQGIIRVHLGG